MQRFHGFALERLACSVGPSLLEVHRAEHPVLQRPTRVKRKRLADRVLGLPQQAGIPKRA